MWKNPENLTDRQQGKLASIQRLNGPLYRAYLFKEQLRQIYRAGSFGEAEALLDGWLSWARRCRIPAFTELARTIKTQREGILAAVRLGLSNARVEQIDTQIRLITRRAYGFQSATALIALAISRWPGSARHSQTGSDNPRKTSGDPVTGWRRAKPAAAALSPARGVRGREAFLLYIWSSIFQLSAI